MFRTKTISLTLLIASGYSTYSLMPPAIAGNNMPPVAPGRLSRPSASPQSSSTTKPGTLSGSVTQSTAAGARLTRPVTGGIAPAVNTAPTGQPSQDTSSGGSLFSDSDKNAFSNVPMVNTSTTSSAPAASVTRSTGVSSSGSNSDSELLRKGLSAVKDIGRAFSQSPALQQEAKNLLKGLASGRGNAATSITGGAQAGTIRPGLPSIPKPSQLFNSGISKVLNKQELALLSNYEIVIVIDKSGSMNETDCPGGLSRWEWCREQLLSFTSQTSSVFRNGITVALFSSGFQVFRSVGFSVVPDIFSKNMPSGGTYMAKPLSQILDEYFGRRDGSPSSTRKLLIQVISDGEPSDKGDLIAAISRASRRMNRPDEVRINFLQIGNERDGMEALNKLDTRLVGDEGAQFDIVSVEPFSAVIQEGLPKALVDTASR